MHVVIYTTHCDLRRQSSTHPEYIDNTIQSRKQVESHQSPPILLAISNHYKSHCLEDTRILDCREEIDRAKQRVKACWWLPWNRRSPRSTWGCWGSRSTAWGQDRVWPGPSATPPSSSPVAGRPARRGKPGRHECPSPRPRWWSNNNNRECCV